MMNQDPAYKDCRIGRWTCGKPKVEFGHMGGKLRIGRYTTFDPGVTILLGGEHRMEWVTTYPFPGLLPKMASSYTDGMLSKGDVKIGSDVSVGTGALILSGVTIGDGATVRPRSVVVRDVPPYAVVEGAPAKVVRYRYSPPIVKRLLRICWWYWPDDVVKQIAPLLLAGDMEKLIRTLPPIR